MQQLQLFTPKKQARGFIVPTFIQDNENLSIGAKYLYGVLCDYARDKHYCYPSKKTLAKQTQSSLNSIRNWIRELAKYGLIETFFNGVKDIFYLFCPADTGAKNFSQGGANFEQGGSNFEPKTNVKETTINPLPPKVVHSDATARKNSRRYKQGGDFIKINKIFEEIWNCYPKKEAKEAARATWFRLVRQQKLPATEILKKSIAFFRESYQWQKQEGRFIPQLVNFLRGGRWTECHDETPQIENKFTPMTDELFRFNHELERKKNEQRQKTQANHERKVKKITEAYEKFRSYFKASNSIENCGGYVIFEGLYEQGKIPVINTKQEISILEFLKSVRCE